MLAGWGRKVRYFARTHELLCRLASSGVPGHNLPPPPHLHGLGDASGLDHDVVNLARRGQPPHLVEQIALLEGQNGR